MELDNDSANILFQLNGSRADQLSGHSPLRMHLDMYDEVLQWDIKRERKATGEEYYTNNRVRMFELLLVIIALSLFTSA